MYDPKDPWPFNGDSIPDRPQKALRVAEPRLGTRFAPTVRARRGWRDRGFDEVPRTVAEAVIGKTDRREFGKLLDKMQQAAKKKRRRK